jgi:hypothetical protein
MKRLILLFWMLSLSMINLSCSDEGQILAGIQDGEELEEGSPVPFLLFQNYPNPFNPSTSISFRIFQPTHVRLKVFTDDWQEVATLSDEERSAGQWQFQFNATGLPSGEYYYTMEALGVTQIRKMKLIK